MAEMGKIEDRFGLHAFLLAWLRSAGTGSRIRAQRRNWLTRPGGGTEAAGSFVLMYK
ncbi:hypothetical protein BRDID11004_46500 [Bradyrhizobium diazoefficiens]|uniref:Uncharacterized protein n=1 Tax=Bradyrhizobium diazoefficiens TaxID=1355477 RepID=A0A810AMF6_9BRAD|nr:hypothetical protein F07S3_42800 [Bradyrhizobium diazoefficiens]BCA03426.1 hypothetical protein H12S4_43300 [Bradyrhizobium diazoefficiens]BCA12129.1 hypothetical protein BDHF08_39760 [Bradyrhizobium diazoefficiens]BCA20788.1 hypothetical protein BDHH15_40030 [Bradyrhizobium diazoefficiens]BCE21401.1 hypothetical protein XF1B_40820 [Bradyrhizobium diazoefficiens]